MQACFAYQRGGCDRGDSCRFTHEGGGGGGGGGRSGPSRMGGGDRVCYAYQKGECDRGSSCRFTHEGGGGGGGGGGGYEGAMNFPSAKSFPKNNKTETLRDLHPIGGEGFLTYHPPPVQCSLAKKLHWLLFPCIRSIY